MMTRFINNKFDSTTRDRFLKIYKVNKRQNYKYG